MNCNLCLNKLNKRVNAFAERDYYLCDNCKLISVPSHNHISYEAEKARYLTHNNGIDQPGYIEFLKRAINPSLKYLTKEMIGLDYGCGYEPTLSKILKREGIYCEDYDPFFVNNNLSKKYDFIFSTEVFEHFSEPLAELTKLDSLLRDNGLLVIMTERWNSLKLFETWYYTRDPSHIVFYHDETFDHIERTFEYARLYDDKQRVIIYKKSNGN